LTVLQIDDSIFSNNMRENGRNYKRQARYDMPQSINLEVLNCVSFVSYVHVP